MTDREEGLAAYPVPLPENPFTNPDLREKSTLGFRPDPMAQTVRGLPARLMQNADESLTKNIMAYMPKPKESRYGSIRMPRASDDPMNAGAFIMAGPIAVEEVLGRFAAKALPGKVLETKLLQMGASKAELETRGVTQYLESQGTRPVHPLEVMKHLDDNPYQLNEIVNKKGEQPTKVYYLAYPDGTTLGSPFKTSEEARLARREAFSDREALQIIRREIQTNPNPPKFEQWQTPGGENYREILLQHPIERKTGWLVFDVAKPNKTLAVLPDEAAAAKYVEENGGVYGPLDYLHGGPETTKHPEFTGGHWDEPNIVAHMRVNDRTLPSGEKALHVEEWQSDWSNEMRRQATATESMATQGVDHKPSIGLTNPLVDNWQDLMARRTLKEAVDGGYDRLTWTTGQQQADRYDLSKQISAVRYNPKLKILEYQPKDDETWIMFREYHFEPKDIPEVIGKGPAEKLLSSPINKDGEYVVQGVDLKVGGEWATKLYDESMVNRFNKIGKRYGVKVEDVPLHSKAKYRFIFNEQPDSPASMREFDTKQQVLLYMKEQFQINDLASMQQAGMSIKKVSPTSSKTQLHSIKITPEMKESIGGSRFHPFADLPGPKPKVAPTPPQLPAAAKKVDLHAEAAALDPSNPVRYVGEMGGYPMYQQEPPGVGSFIVRPGETAATAFARAKARYQK